MIHPCNHPAIEVAGFFMRRHGLPCSNRVSGFFASLYR